MALKRAVMLLRRISERHIFGTAGRATGQTIHLVGRAGRQQIGCPGTTQWSMAFHAILEDNAIYLAIFNKMANIKSTPKITMKSASTLSNGRVVIPAALREQLDIRDGDQLIWSVSAGALVATTRRAQLRKAQARFQSLLPAGTTSLTEELIAERRAASETE